MEQVREKVAEIVGNKDATEGWTRFVEEVGEWLLNSQAERQHEVSNTLAGLISYGAITQKKLQNVGRGEYEAFRSALAEEGVRKAICDLLFEQYVADKSLVESKAKRATSHDEDRSTTKRQRKERAVSMNQEKESEKRVTKEEPKHNRSFAIFIKAVDGKSICLMVDASDTIESVKLKIEKRWGYPSSLQTLFLANQKLEASSSLEDCKLHQGDTVRMVLGLQPTVSIKQESSGQKRAIQSQSNRRFRILIESTIRRFPVLVSPRDTIEILKNRITEIDGFPPDQQRLYYAGQQLEDGFSVEDYNIQPGDTLRFILRLCGSIGSFTVSNADDDVNRWLMLPDGERMATSAPSANILKQEMDRLKASDSLAFEIQHTGDTLLSANQRQSAIRFLDVVRKQFCRCEMDMKVTFDMLGEQAFGSFLGLKGENGLHKLRSFHSGSSRIALRRTEGPIEGCIKWHVDVEQASETVQLTLNDDSEYDGGRICFVTGKDAKLTVPQRPAGTLTVHRRNVLHAVTKLHRGTRYSLFVLDSRNLGQDFLVLTKKDTSSIIQELLTA